MKVSRILSGSLKTIALRGSFNLEDERLYLWRGNDPAAFSVTLNSNTLGDQSKLKHLT